MVIINKTDYHEYCNAIKNSKHHAICIPVDVINKAKEHILRYPNKYIDYFFWVLLTAPKTLYTVEEQKCIRFMKDVIKSNVKIKE